MSIECLSPDPEILNEKELFEQRLPELEQELAEGTYGGRPLHFLAGLEIELYIGDDTVRVLRQSAISAMGPFVAKPPEEWREVWAHSAVRQRMFGEQNETYIQELFAAVASKG